MFENTEEVTVATEAGPNRERIALWVKELRNPDLVQANGILAQSDKPDGPWRQCCLDVACRVAMDNGLELKEHIRVPSEGDPFYSRGYETGGDPDSYGEDVTYSILPPAVRDWYGFDSKWVGVKLGDQGWDATVLNDDLRLTFSKIADAVEATYLQDGK